MVHPRLGTEASSKPMTGPGVRIPPPVFYAAMLGLGWLLQRVVPLPFLPAYVAHLSGGVITAGGLALALFSSTTLVCNHGTLNTDGRSEALVTRGPYRFSRNPVYVALATMYVGVMVILGIPWSLLALPLLLIYTQTMVIAREEAFLRQVFGSEFSDYCSHVRRWL